MSSKWPGFNDECWIGWLRNTFIFFCKTYQIVCCLQLPLTTVDATFNVGSYHYVWKVMVTLLPDSDKIAWHISRRLTNRYNRDRNWADKKWKKLLPWYDHSIILDIHKTFIIEIKLSSIHVLFTVFALTFVVTTSAMPALHQTGELSVWTKDHQKHTRMKQTHKIHVL